MFILIICKCEQEFIDYDYVVITILFKRIKEVIYKWQLEKLMIEVRCMK
jgi:hypothetical protein